MTETEEKPAVKVEKEEEETPQTADEVTNQKLLAQIEYYFGDVNLPRDKFIKEECSKNDGWFPVATLLKFNRVLNLLRSVENDDRIKRICHALKPSELVDTNEGDLKIRRNPECPLPEKDSEERTVYLKGFHHTETTLDDLLEFFKKYEGVESVIMRYYKEKTIKTEAEIKKEKEEKQGLSSENGDVKTENGAEQKSEEKSEPQLVWIRKFKGSIFVICKTVEQAKKVLEEDIVFNSTPIKIKMWQAEYKTQKNKEYQEKLAHRKRKLGGGDKKAEDEEKEEDVKDQIPKGALLKILNVPEGYTREIIKEKWFAALDKEKFAIAFIDFNKGDKNAVLRLEIEGAANEALDAIPDKKLKMKDAADDQETVFSEMEGFGKEEEVSYIQEIKRQREANKNQKKRGHHGGRGGRGGKRRRRY
jgi:lupus La protein